MSVQAALCMSTSSLLLCLDRFSECACVLILAWSSSSGTTHCLFLPQPSRFSSLHQFEMRLDLKILFLVAGAISLFTPTHATCYFPDKSIDADGFPCNLTTGAVTHCCRTFEACIDNGVCYTQWDSQFYRRSCTDENWSDGCPTVCTDGKSMQPEIFLRTVQSKV